MYSTPALMRFKSSARSASMALDLLWFILASPVLYRLRISGWRPLHPRFNGVLNPARAPDDDDHQRTNREHAAAQGDLGEGLNLFDAVRQTPASRPSHGGFIAIVVREDAEMLFCLFVLEVTGWAVLRQFQLAANPNAI